MDRRHSIFALLSLAAACARADIALTLGLLQAVLALYKINSDSEVELRRIEAMREMARNAEMQRLLMQQSGGVQMHMQQMPTQQMPMAPHLYTDPNMLYNQFNNPVNMEAPLTRGNNQSLLIAQGNPNIIQNGQFNPICSNVNRLELKGIHEFQRDTGYLPTPKTARFVPNQQNVVQISRKLIDSQLDPSVWKPTYVREMQIDGRSRSLGYLASNERTGEKKVGFF